MNMMAMDEMICSQDFTSNLPSSGMLWMGEHRPRKKHRMGRPGMRNVIVELLFEGGKTRLPCEVRE